MMMLARRSILFAPLLLACQRSKIDPGIAAWLGEAGDPPTPKLFAKLTRKSTRDDVRAAFPNVEPWGGSLHARTNAAPGLEWIEFILPDTLYSVTVVYSAAASTPEMYQKLLAALTARYGPPKNPGGLTVMYMTKDVHVAVSEKDAMAGHRATFYM